MSNPAAFGVLEVAWEMTLAGPAGEAPRTTSEATPHDLETLPFRPYQVTGVDAVSVHHMRVTRTLSRMTAPDAPRERVPTPTLITEYEVDNDRLLRLMQYVPPQGNSVVFRVAAGMTRQIEVGSAAGLYIQGRWYADGGATTAYWDPTGGATLLWQLDERALELYGEGFSADELLQFAIDLA